MLAANVCASDFLEGAQAAGAVPRPRRPDAGEADEAARLPRRVRPAARRRRRSARQGLRASCWRRSRTGPDMQLLQTVMLRSLRQAIYSPDNVGHFGLAYESYTHFTSPIRRYPDLLVHRAIKAVLAGRQVHAGGNWEEIGMHCSATERRADEATRDVEAWLKCYYMQDRIGEEFDGTHLRRGALRHLRRAGRGLRRRPGACFRTRARLFPFRRSKHHAWSASAPAGASASPTACACNWCASTWNRTRSTSVLAEAGAAAVQGPSAGVDRNRPARQSFAPEVILVRPLHEGVNTAWQRPPHRATTSSSMPEIATRRLRPASPALAGMLS